MGAALKLKPEPARLSEARKALAEEIEIVSALTARRDALRRVNGDDQVFEAQRRLDDTQADLARAVEADREAATEAVIYGDARPAPMGHAARQRVEEAGVALEDARRIRADLRAEAAELEKRLGHRWRMPGLIAAVLQDEAAPTVNALNAQIEALQLKLVEKAATLAILVRSGAAPDIVDHQYTRAGRLHGQVSGLADLFGIKAVEIEASAWAAAIKALETDADARLPL